MGFTYTNTEKTIVGTKWMSWGTFTSDTNAGGDIYTMLELVEHFQLTQNADAVTTGAPTVNETLPKADPITIVTDAGVDGYWLAIGRM
jgi:hypothetical protein